MRKVKASKGQNVEVYFYIKPIKSYWCYTNYNFSN